MCNIKFSLDKGILSLILLLFIPCIIFSQYSADEDPRETNLDPGDIFLAGPACEMDDGDGSCPPPSLLVPNPEAFDLDAYSHEPPLEVCPSPPPSYPPGILFSFDDGDPGPGSGLPDNHTEIFFYDHCLTLHPTTRYSYMTTITENFLGLGLDPPPPAADDDVDAYEARFLPAEQWAVLFSPDTPSDGGFGPGSEGNIYYMDPFLVSPTIWATPATLGVPDLENCDIDGIATIRDPDQDDWMVLFTTDHTAPCGLDPGDIYVSNNNSASPMYWLYADDVFDLKIAYDEDDKVDIDALAINYFGDFGIDGTFEPDDPTFYKADWPNYAPNGMPDFSQDHQGWPPTYCGPTSVADSFWWFDSEMECDKDLLSGDSNETEPNDGATSADMLGEVPALVGALATNTDVDWYRFDIPGKSHRRCRVRVSTCALRQLGDADTLISLYDGSTGVPGTLVATNDDGCLPDTQSEINAGVNAGTRYYVKVEAGPSGTLGNYTLTLGVDCYRLVEVYPDEPDDHSDHNVRPLIEDLSKCMNTDDVSGGGGWKGTRITDMQNCIDNWLFNNNLDDIFYETTVYAPIFDEVAEEIERSEDVILLLGFYWFDGVDWIRCGGHYVTSAGVDSVAQLITVSDPKLNNTEAGGVGRVLGPDHANHAPTASPPPSHDDAQNICHDRYLSGPPSVPPSTSSWSIPDYATAGGSTVCQDVRWWCMDGYDWGQNWPADTPPFQAPCPDPFMPVSVEVEAMVDVSPEQTAICLYLDSSIPWDENLRIEKNPCTVINPTAVSYDVIRGKLCNLAFNMLLPEVDLGHVQCLYNDVSVDHYDELSPDDTDCFGSWFYLIRRSTDPDYGNASAPGSEPRKPSSGGCP